MKKLILILLSLLLVGCTKVSDFNDDDDEPPIEEKERFEVNFDENETFNSNEEKIASEHIDAYIKQAVVILNTINLEEIEVLSEDYNLRLERNKLNDNAKQIYDALISNVSNYNDFNYEDKNTSSLISDYLSALTALKLDRRDLSLYCDFKYDYPYYKSVYYLPNQWMKGCLDIDEVKAQVKIYQATIERIIEKMPNNLSNYYKCWYFVFVISLATKYDNSQITSLHQFQAYDCLVNGKCVCQGYTEAFY